MRFRSLVVATALTCGACTSPAERAALDAMRAARDARLAAIDARLHACPDTACVEFWIGERYRERTGVPMLPR